MKLIIHNAKSQILLERIAVVIMNLMIQPFKTKKTFFIKQPQLRQVKKHATMPILCQLG